MRTISIPSLGLTDLTPAHAQQPELLKSVRSTRERSEFSPKGRYSISKQICLKERAEGT